MRVIMSPEQLSQNILKIAEQTINDLMNEHWSDQGPIAALLKGQFSIAANYILPEITLEFLQQITTHEQLDLVNNYLTMQEKLQTPAKDELAKLAELWGIEDTQAKTKVAIVSEQLAVLLTNPANAKKLLELKYDIVGNPGMGVTDERLVKLAAGEYDDFFILQESYGKNAVDNAKQAKEILDNNEENSHGAENTDYVICNTVYKQYENWSEKDPSYHTITEIYLVISEFNKIDNTFFSISKEKNPEIILMRIAHGDTAFNQNLMNTQRIIESTTNPRLRQLAFQSNQTLKNLEVLWKAYKFSLLHKGDFQNQSFYFINELITPSAIQQVWLKNLQADQPAIATNQDLRIFTQGLYSRPASLISLANENSFLLDIIADREETVKEKFSNVQAKADLKNLSHLKTLILNHNKSLIKQALPAKAWQEYLGLANPLYLEPVLDKLCQNATPADVIKFIALADKYRDQTLPKFIKALTKQDFSPHFFKDFMQAPEAVAIFNSDIAKLDQKLEAASNKVDRLQHPQPGLMDRLLGKAPTTDQAKLQEAKQAVKALTNARANLVAAPLEKRLNFMQKAIQFVPKLFKRLGAMLNPSQTSLALPHPTLQRVTVSSLAELARLVDSNKIHQLSITQLLNLLDHRLLVTHESEGTSPDSMLKIRTKIKLRVALKQRFNRHPNFFTSDLQAIYTLKILPITSQELLQLITDHKDNRYVLRHISSDALWQFFQDEKLDISQKLQVAKLLSKIKIHPTLCQENIKALSAQLVTSQAQKDHGPAVEKSNVQPSKTIGFTGKFWGFFAKNLTAKDQKQVSVPTQDPTTQQRLPDNPQHAEEANLEKVNKMGGFSYLNGLSN